MPRRERFCDIPHYQVRPSIRRPFHVVKERILPAQPFESREVVVIVLLDDVQHDVGITIALLA